MIFQIGVPSPSSPLPASAPLGPWLGCDAAASASAALAAARATRTTRPTRACSASAGAPGAVRPAGCVRALSLPLALLGLLPLLVAAPLELLFGLVARVLHALAEDAERDAADRRGSERAVCAYSATPAPRRSRNHRAKSTTQRLPSSFRARPKRACDSRSWLAFLAIAIRERDGARGHVRSERGLRVRHLGRSDLRLRHGDAAIDRGRQARSCGRRRRRRVVLEREQSAELASTFPLRSQQRTRRTSRASSRARNRIVARSA